MAFQILNDLPPITWISSRSPSLSVSPEYFNPFKRPANRLFFKINWSVNTIGSKVNVEILFASTTDPNSLESPSFAVKI